MYVPVAVVASKMGNKKMGMWDKFDDPTPMPDIYGLPVYRPTKIIKERIGDEVRMLCGYEMFGQTVYTHVTILQISDMALIAKEFDAMGRDARNEGLTIDVRRAMGH